MLFFVYLFFLLAACATPGTGERKGHASPKPSETQARAAVLEYLWETLKDPGSLKQFKIRSGPEIITWYRGLMSGGGHEQAWLICFEYNAKNSFGAYVGAKVDGVVVRTLDDSVIRVLDVNWGLADRGCS